MEAKEEAERMLANRSEDSMARWRSAAGENAIPHASAIRWPAREWLLCRRVSGAGRRTKVPEDGTRGPQADAMEISIFG